MPGVFEEWGEWFFEIEGHKFGPFPNDEEAESARQEILRKRWDSCSTGSCEE